MGSIANIFKTLLNIIGGDSSEKETCSYLMWENIEIPHIQIIKIALTVNLKVIQMKKFEDTLV